MTRRNTERSRKTLADNRLIRILIAAVFVFAAAAGIYFLTQTAETSPSIDTMNQTSFTQRTFENLATEVDFKEAPSNPPGTVTDTTKDEPKDTEDTEPPQEEIEEAAADSEATDSIAVPEPDLSSMIANAKTFVYTIYTDLDQGSGFLFNNKGDILTNAHVVKDSQYVTVKNSNGQEFNGRVIGISETTDIALIRITEIAGKAPMEMEMQQVPVDTKVFALGSPENINNTSTEGVITATDKSFVDGYEYDDLYEMTAKIKQGSSGGPLISAQSGKILGINSIVLTDNPDIGYTIPIYSVIDQLQEWAENPLAADSEIVHPDVSAAFFEEELLRGFISDFYELVPYSLNDDEVEYYKFFLLSGSQGEMFGNEMIQGLKGEQRAFQAAEHSITGIEIDDNEAYVTANSTFKFHDQEDDRLVSIRHAVVYTIVIDRFGDYQISAIHNQDQ
ncbi:S1C family serine protease [Planococcus sp. X10-3]|uniref:S1C family serine protease n=1 Tax=Planococcus sp. X10-3 TaxID=3061240 RepID=UPI003BAFEF25